MKLNNKEICYTFLVFLLLHSVPATTAREAEHEKEFDYIEGSSKGPENWSKLHEEWMMCGTGAMQSPIDLPNKREEVLPSLGKLETKYNPASASLKNRGHDIMLTWAEGAGAIYLNGTEYNLKQCHWHFPSEHTINGKRYDMEIHMVHQSSENKRAVIGIMYKIGQPDTFLSKVTDYIKSISHMEDAEKEVGVVDPSHVNIGSGKHYRYMGSLTVPPCEEGVVWTIVRKVRTVSREQVELLREAVYDNAERNARPTQATNERPIHLYSPRDGVQY